MNKTKALIYVIGVGLIIDGIGSLLTPMNNHNFLLDFGRALRTLAGFVLIGIEITRK